MKHHLFTIAAGIGLGAASLLHAQSAVDVLHYRFWLDSVDFNGKRIYAKARIVYRGLQPDSAFTLMLKSLTVDSVRHSGPDTPVAFMHAGEQLHIRRAVQAGGVDSVEVFYHGRPFRDPVWGGVYFQSGPPPYVYNLGVGFQAVPHSLGRAWVLAVEDFTDKARWDFYLRVPAGYVGLANGRLVDSPHGTNPYWHWQMRHPIPAYLAAWAVGPFHTMEIPVGPLTAQIHALAADTAKVAGSFVHLDSAFAIFRRRYGPYRFDRLAYLLIPMAGGMEHATFIALGRNLVTGDTRYEGIIVHELAHQWWGDPLTAANEGDMWLNEGWATFSEWLFYEDMYGRQHRVDHIRRIFSEVVHHVDRLTNRNPVAPVPPNLTYDGLLVYDRGGMTAHNLRYYMGDSLFFAAIRRLMDRAAFGNVSSAALRDSFTAYSGMDLSAFFDDWVWKPGFPLFRIVRVDTLSPTTYRVVVDQHLRHAPSLYRDVPIEVTAFLANGGIERRRFTFNGRRDSAVLSFSAAPRLLWLWPDNELATASISRQWTLTDTQWHAWPYGYVDVKKTGTGDARVIIAHRWLNPDSAQTAGGVQPNPLRYWTVGVDSPIAGRLRFYYHGRRGNRGRTAYVDYPFIRNETELVLLYRRSPAEPWQVLSGAVHHMGSRNDYAGSFETALLPGDYALGKGGTGSGIRQWFRRLKFFFDGEAVIFPPDVPPARHVAWVDAQGRTVEVHPGGYRRIPMPGRGPLWLQCSWEDAPPALVGPFVRMR